MGNSMFGPPPNNEPSIPAGSDAFDVPQPNFRLIGQMLQSGIQDAKAAGASGGLGGFLAHPLDTSLTYIATGIAWILSKLLCIIAFLLQLITSIDDGASPGMAAVINQSLAHVFGVPLAGTQPRKIAAGTDGTTTGAAIGTSILNAIATGTGQASGATIGPTPLPAQQFLGALAKIGIEGWIDGFVAEAIGGTHLQSVLELAPIMADILGLGRVSRRVLQVPVKTFVTDPYTWFLNSQYRPTLLSEEAIIREVLRGAIPVAQLDTLMAPHGHSPANITALLNLHALHLSLEDIDYLVNSGTWSQQSGLQELMNQGYSQDTALTLMSVQADRRLDAIDRKYLDANVAAFIRGDIDQGQMSTAIQNSRMSAAEQNQFEAAAVAERVLHPRHMTLGEVTACVKAKIMTIDDLQSWLAMHNYPPNEATFLELLVLGEVTTADAAAAAKLAKQQAAQAKAAAAALAAPAKAAAAAAKATVKGITLADMEKLVEQGQKTFADFVAYLQALSLPQDSIDTLVTLLHEKITTSENTTVQANGLEAEATAKQIPLATIAAAVVSGQLTIDDLTTFMKGHNYADSEIAIEVASVQAKLAKAQGKTGATTTATAAAAAKSISLPDLERAARLGLTTVDAYGAALTAAGYDANSVTLMEGILNDQIASDKAALAKRTAAAAKAATKGLSLAQLEQAVLDGLQPIAAYSAELTSLGYSTDDVGTLVSLLEVRINNAKAVAAKKSSAQAALSAQGLTLTDLERAVRLGVLSIEQFSADLTAAGMSAADIDLLAASETADQQKEAAAAQKAAAASTALKVKGISLAQEQNLVKNGISTLTAYTAFLANLGYSAGDAADLTQLLSDQIDQAKAAATLHAAAAAKSADKDITLASEEKAVIAGIQTMSDYEAYLADLGYDATDTATLVALLEAKMGTSTTPAAAGVTATAPATP